jgi:hypothetical protein
VTPGVAALAALLAVGAPPSSYRVAATTATREALLAGDAKAWAPAARVRWGPAQYATEFAAVWDADALYLRFAATDPMPWHTMTHRDDHLWEEEVVEIFLDPARSGRDYFELEISPANVVCDVRMERPSPDKKYDLTWNFDGLETRVVPSIPGRAKGWTALARLPWSGFRSLPSTTGVALPPRAADRWRFNLFRVDRPGGKAKPEENAVEIAWSPTGQPSFHVPAAFRDFVFGDTKAAPPPRR